MIKQFLIIIYPHILQFDIKHIVQYLFDFILSLKLTNRTERRLLLPIIQRICLKLLRCITPNSS